MKPRYVMVIETEKCVRCMACVVSCREENDVPEGHSRNWIAVDGPRGKYPSLGMSFVPGQCMQCAEPHCVRVCPTGATFQNDVGVTEVDPEMCIGCRYCMQACPYDARYFDREKGIVDKCDFCMHRVRRGQEPSCVTTCPSRARHFGDINDPESEVSKLIASRRTHRKKVEAGTDPQIYYVD
ncbi:MAG: 4Fe-4S dicluster domain-containing protein [Gemmatimonadetes bacterium]|nr:4Fe-4S dicluster domain-containing protein [Gemmatimonadota bacterium]